MFIGPVNWIAVVAAAVVTMAIGFFWYSKTGFGKAWMRAMKMSEAQPQKAQQEASKGYLINFVVVLVTSYTLAHVVRLAGATSFADGAAVGFWMWLGFLLPLGIGGMLWERRSSKLTQINASYQLVQMLIMGGILAVWV